MVLNGFSAPGLAGARFGGLIVLAGSAALLGGALAFQYVGGLAPCELCIWQRWAHGAALAGALIALVAPGRLASLGLAFAVAGLLAGVGIAVFHAGVEQQWWQGLASCGGGGTSAGSAEDLLQAIEAAPIVRCDDIAWTFLGLSMAVWNALISAGIAALAVVAARRR